LLLSSEKQLIGSSISPLIWKIEDGVIWVYGLCDDSVIAFTPFGIETLRELIEMDLRHAR